MWNKLKHEWKTLAWGTASLAVEVEIYMDPTILDPFVSDEYKGLVHIAVPTGFFLLRRWKDAHEDKNV